jgi:hypothetical protein
MYFGAAPRRACGRAVVAGSLAGAPAWGCICLRVQSPLRTHRCAYHAHAHARVRACVATFPWLRPGSCPRLPIVARRARAARARGARQVHLLHEGDGAPRVARPVQALGGTVRPRPRHRRRARSRRCGRRAAATGAAAPGAGPHRAALDAAAAAPGVGRGRAHARIAGARVRPARFWGGPEPLGAAARLARRYAYSTELAALPAAVDWPSLKKL